MNNLHLRHNKRKKGNLFTWCELKGLIHCQTYLKTQPKDIGEECSCSHHWNYLGLLCHLHKRQILFWNVCEHWKPLRIFTDQCWPYGISMIRVFTKPRSLGCTIRDSDSLGLEKGSREGERKERRKMWTNNCGKLQVQILVMIYEKLMGFPPPKPALKVCSLKKLCRMPKVSSLQWAFIFGGGKGKDERGLSMIIILLHRKQGSMFPQVSYNYKSSGFIFKTLIS